MQHRLAVSFACAILLAGCGDYSAPSEVVNGTVTASLQAPNANFAQYKTFSVTPTIHVVDSTTGTTEEYNRDAGQIVNQVVQNMQNYGYTYVPFINVTTPPPNVDLVIALYAKLGNVVYAGSYCDWWYWGYYPYGCGWTYAGSYNFGTIILRMGDFKNAPPGVTPPPGSPTTPSVLVVWGSATYGVSGTQSYNLQRILTSIDTAFAQSPYLKH